jgi:type I restriction enzyme S subunit
LSEQNGLPGGWSTATIGELLDIVRGVTFPSAAKKFHPQLNHIACLRTANVQREVEWDDLWFIPEEYVKREEQVVKSSDILISTANSYELVGKVARVKHMPFTATLGAFISLLRGPHLLDSDYVYCFLSSYETQSRIREMASTTTNISNVSTKKLETLTLKIPPLPEQRRIVGAIEEQFSRLDAGVSALERVRANLRRYRTAVLKAAVEGRLTEAWREENPGVEPAQELLERILKERRERWERDQLAAYEKKGKKPPKNWRSKYKEPAGPDTENLPELPEGWCWISVEQLLIQQMVNGISIKGSDDPPGVPALRLSAMSDRGFDYTDHRYIPIDEKMAESLAVREGDFFVSRGNGSLHLVGRGTLAQNPVERIVFPDTMIRLRSSNLPDLRSFLSVAWSSRLLRTQIEKAARTTAGIYKISQRDIGNFAVSLPPLEEQKEIVLEVERRMSVLQEVETEVEANLKRTSRLRQSILKRAFEGKLVPQDPSEEPASELLERIRAERERNTSGKGRRKKKTAPKDSKEPQPSLFPGTRA